MYQLTVSTRRDLERATLRAQAQKPKIEEVVFGIYKVWSSNPAITEPYLVGIEAAPDGGYEVCCSCPTQRYLCKHVASVFPHYLMRLKEQVEPEAAQEAAPEAEQEPVQPVCGCGKNAYAHFNGAWHCIDCVKEKQAQIEEAEHLYPDLLEPIYKADAEYKAARAQAELALAALAASGFQPTRPGEEIQSMDRHCPSCGLVQPDDDSSDCLACGAVLDPEDEYTDAQADYDRACLFG